MDEGYLEDAKEWLSFATDDLGVAKHLYETYYPRPLAIICFHCQQAAEKAVKSIIFAKNRKHAKFIVDMFHEMFPELGDAFIQQIDGSIDYHEQIIDDFRTADRMPQIAVSVDMMDTGIDVPEVLNLVFFKMVRSYSKFWQMIGRGTRLCPGLFGPGFDKKCFYIFDYGGNFEYFSLEGSKLKEEKNQPSLAERIFNLQANLYLLLYRDKEPERQELARKLFERLHGAVMGLDDTSFRVIQNREQVERYRDKRIPAIFRSRPLPE
ncbi:MAG: HEPN domain-containing protein [Selenomonadaceae bacterium]|nr:HEPN domain-containing protein [Selenomonadaceae bacterium]